METNGPVLSGFGSDSNGQAGDRLVGLSASVVSAYVSNNALSVSDLPRLIEQVHAALAALGNKADVEETPDLRPAVTVRKSITPDYLICLEDGKKFKSLKRHLRTEYDMSPEEYRSKWNLPADYPMVAPNYSAARSRLAKSIGLGRKPATSSAGATRPRSKAFA